MSVISLMVIKKLNQSSEKNFRIISIVILLVANIYFTILWLFNSNIQKNVVEVLNREKGIYLQEFRRKPFLRVCDKSFSIVEHGWLQEKRLFDLGCCEVKVVDLTTFMVKLERNCSKSILFSKQMDTITYVFPQ
jgi:hypothetical protein